MLENGSWTENYRLVPVSASAPLHIRAQPSAAGDGGQWLVSVSVPRVLPALVGFECLRGARGQFLLPSDSLCSVPQNKSYIIAT